MSVNRRPMARSILILGLIGTLVSAQQASAQSVFIGRSAGEIETISTRPLILAHVSTPGPGAGALEFSMFKADTVETFDVDVDEDKGPGIGKQLAIFAIVTVIVGYAVIELLKPDDTESTGSKTSGKPTPDTVAPVGFKIPFSR
jgi:hypothetical protein